MTDKEGIEADLKCQEQLLEELLVDLENIKANIETNKDALTHRIRLISEIKRRYDSEVKSIHEHYGALLRPEILAEEKLKTINGELGSELDDTKDQIQRVRRNIEDLKIQITESYDTAMAMKVMDHIRSYLAIHKTMNIKDLVSLFYGPSWSSLDIWNISRCMAPYTKFVTTNSRGELTASALLLDSDDIEAVIKSHYDKPKKRCKHCNEAFGLTG